MSNIRFSIFFHPVGKRQLQHESDTLNLPPNSQQNPILVYVVFCLATAALVLALCHLNGASSTAAPLCVVGADLGYTLKLLSL